MVFMCTALKGQILTLDNRQKKGLIILNMCSLVVEMRSLLAMFFYIVLLLLRCGPCFYLMWIYLGCSLNRFLISLSSGIVLGWATKGREFGGCGFWPFGVPYSWNEIIGFLKTTRSPRIRCMGEFGRAAYGGLLFVKSL